MTIREMRQAANMKQIEVAREIGCTQVSVFQWESGKSYPTPDKITKLAELYHTTADKIIQAIREAKETA